MVEIKEAVKKLAAGLDNTADAMLVVIINDGSARAGMFGLDETYSGKDAQGLALTLQYMLDTDLRAAREKAKCNRAKGEFLFHPGKPSTGRGLGNMEELMKKSRHSAEEQREADYEAIARRLLAILTGRDEA